MKKGAKIKYAIIKQVSMYSFIEWLESWEINREDWDNFMKAGEQALDGKDSDIEDALIIDAVEVVRCKDCKYGEEIIEDYRCWMLDEDWDIRFSPMHFCSYGRHKEESEVEE